MLEIDEVVSGVMTLFLKKLVVCHREAHGAKVNSDGGR